MAFVKIYGAQRSGTNLLKFLIEANFSDAIVVDLPLGNKHERPQPARALEAWRTSDTRPVDINRLPYSTADLEEALLANEVRAVAVVKPLLAWLASFYRYRRLKEPDRYPTLTPKMCTLWTRRWLEINASFVTELQSLRWRHCIVGYVQLTEDFETTMNQLMSRLALGRAQAGGWVTTDRAMKRSTDEMHGEALLSDQPFASDYYAARRYVAEFSPDLLDAVRQEVSQTPSAALLRPFTDVEVTGSVTTGGEG